MRTMRHRRSAGRCVLIVVLLLAGMAFAQPAAQSASVEQQIRDTLPKLTERESGKEAVETLQGLRDERVLRLFEHVRDSTLYERNGKVVFVPTVRDLPDGNKAGEAYDLFAPLDADGKPTGPPAETVPMAELTGHEFTVPRPVRIAIANGLRVLGLKMDDAGLRKQAALDLGNRRQADALPELRAVADKDPVAGVQRAAKESIALIVASGQEPSATPEQKQAAVAELGALTSIRALDLLKADAAKPGLDPKLADTYKKSIGQIERHQSFTNWIKNAFFGLSAGSIYVLLALGLAITFGLMGVINMAHGEMMMIGAVTTWACCEYIGKALPPQYFDYYYVIAFPASFIVAALFGLLIEVSIVRWLYKRPLDSLLATIGVSYVLIQIVRNWKGDNLGMQTPGWAGRNIEIIQDVLLPYNRLFLIALTVFCLLSVIALFRYTKLGLMIRATVQNREMAQALGVNTRLVDMTTFAFGAGLAGLAGYGIVLTSNPSPEIGQTFIVKSFLTVVVGGVGKLFGVVISGLGLGFIEKVLEPIQIIQTPIHLFDATWAQVGALVVVILFMQRRPAGLFPDKGRAADQADRVSAPPVPKITPRGDLLFGGVLILLGLVLVPLLYGTGNMSLEYVNKLGYILSFAICAIGLDLIWGYIGVLSLTQFLFFAIGGYAMGLYLINYGPMDGDGHNVPHALFVVSSAVSGAKPPWFLGLFKTFPLTVVLGMLLPGLLALLIGLTTFRSRVRGVYFSILTQAITVAFWLVFQKNEMSLGGTNGLTNFTHILGHPIAANDGGPFVQTRFWLYVASFVSLMVAVLVAKLLVNSGFGRVLVAIRDDETRLRFVGYQTWAYKAATFAIAAIFAAVGGMLYSPQKGIITPQQIAAVASIQVVAWVAIGGRGSIWGAVLGSVFVSLLYESLTSGAPRWFQAFCGSFDFDKTGWVPDGSWLVKIWSPDSWLIVLGMLFILVPLLLPGGIISLPMVIKKLSRKRKTGAPVLDAAAAELAEAR